MKKQRRAIPQGYVQNSLLPGEKVYGIGVVHWATVTMPLLIGLVGTVFVAMFLMFGLLDTTKLWLALYVLPNAFLIQAIIYLYTTESAVTNSRVLLKTGWISRFTDEISLTKVESILMSQGVLGRIFNFGNVTVVGTGGNKVILRGISNPMAFRSTVQSVAMNGR